MRIRRFFILLSKTLGVGILLIALGIGAVLTRLYVRPVDLSVLTPQIARFLQEETGKTSLQLEKPELRWRGPGHSLEIAAENLRLETAAAAGLSLHMPKLYLTFRFRSLIRGEFLPATLTLEGPQATYHPPKAADQEDTAAPGAEAPQESILELVRDSLQGDNPSKALKRIRVVDAALFLDLGAGIGRWDLPQVTFILNRKQGFVDGFLDLGFPDGQKVTGTFASMPQDATWQMNLTLQALSLPFFAHKLTEQKVLEAPLLREIAESTLPVSGEVTLTLSEGLALQKAQGRLEVPEGRLTLPSILPDAQPLREVTLAGTYDRAQGLATQFSATVGQASLTGEVDLTPKGAVSEAVAPEGVVTKESKEGQEGDTRDLLPGYKLSVKAEVQNFSLQNLGGVWPKEAAAPARTWLTANLTEGLIPRATFALQGRLGGGATVFTLGGLEGEIHLDQGMLRYHPDLPPLTALAAQVHYTNAQFMLHGVRGESGGLTLDGGRVAITGLGGDAPNLDLRVTARGLLPAALSFLGSKPLDMLKETALEPEKCQGDAVTDLHLSFPLDERFETQGITFSAKGQLQNAAAPRVLSFLPIGLSKANLTYEVTKEQVKASGTANLNQVPATIEWVRSLNPKKKSETARVKAPVTPAFLKTLKVDVGSYLKGSVSTEIVYKTGAGQKSTLVVSLDLTPAQVAVGTWVKPFKSRGLVKADWALPADGRIRLEKIRVDAPPFALRAQGTFGKDFSAVEEVTVKELKLGETTLKGSLSRGKDVDYKISVEGESLDLTPLLEGMKKDGSTPPEFHKTIEMRARIGVLTLLKGRRFYNNFMNLRFLNNRIHSVAYKGFLNPEATKEFYIDLLPRANNGRRLRLKCFDAGHMLKALNFFDDVSEGYLKLTADQLSDRPNAPWQGKLEVKDFWLEKAPVISRLLSLAFPTGLVNAFSRKGLAFDRLKVKFKKAGSTVSLYRGRSYSPSFGFSVHGSILEDFSVLNVHGTVYPAYFFNTLLSRIPLLGQLLTGGKHEGIWGVSYTVTGPSSQPKIQVNPLTAFAPGVFRKLFLPAEEGGFDDENDPEEDDDNEAEGDPRGDSLLD